MSPKESSFKETAGFFFRGLLMGVADIIPGVSGGTLAFITGIYQRLIHALSSIKLRKIHHLDYQLLAPLGLGIVTSILLLSKLMSYLLLTYPAVTFSFFFGVIVASAVFLIKKAGKLNVEKSIFAVIGFLGAYLMAGAAVIYLSHSLITIFFTAMLAICAMLLPGISGAFLLLLLNQYQYILESLQALRISVIATFVAGAITGLLLFSKVIDYLLKHFKHLTISFLIGLMLGSLRIPWQQMATSSDTLTIVLVAVIGFLLVSFLESLYDG
ncbi:DUF368 domain-containing protein [Candidatus Woesearchaeota archaeon CG10_big_fil_rev_8_21_14_0_10_45_16]|nr:MAG: DUF368 domain-containing protein [Candidatus Woesearchaeota archaeon CG10_big_fil_rev_8_21_14_0_10_45_16]